MNRILEFIPSQEEALVSRVLVLVHQAMDQHLPNAGQANRQFTKTVFAEDGEQTAVSGLAFGGDDHHAEDTAPKTADAFGSNEVTSPNGQPEALTENGVAEPVMPPPPRPKRDNAATRDGSGAPSAAAPTTKPSSRGGSKSLAAEPSQNTGSPSRSGQKRKAKSHEGPDWVTRITLGLLLAGLLLLGYVLMTQ